MLLTFHNIFKKRNKILVKRDLGGLGDIFMHRMIFEDIKMALPDGEVIFACPSKYHAAVIDHPFIDSVVDCKKIDEGDFILSYNTSKACISYELQTSPFVTKHRSDIWAEHCCGITLNNHNMHFQFLEKEKEIAREKIRSINQKNKKTVLISPVSAMASKNLDPEQINPFIKEIENNYCVFITHSRPLEGYESYVFHDLNIRELMSVVNEVDYVISVDTAVFHLAGGLQKPQIGVFAWADGDVYGKYYYNKMMVQKHRKNGNWNCGPCFNFGLCTKDSKSIRKPCITEINSSMIKDAFDKLVKEHNK